MPRRHRRKPEEAPPVRSRSITEPIPAPPGWTAQRYKGVASADEQYVCPRCHRAVARGSEHVVAWQVDGDQLHRHWHTACWRSAVREGIERYRFA